MAKKFYVLNTEEQVQAGTEKYRLVQGKELDTLIQTKEWKGKEFIFQKQVNGDVIGVEAPAEMKKEVEAEKQREKYLRRIIRNGRFLITSLEISIGNEEKGSGEDVIADESADIEQQFLAKEEIETLKEAMNKLTEEEFYYIYALYLSEKPKTIQGLAEELNVTRMTVYRRKQAILAKLKNFF